MNKIFLFSLFISFLSLIQNSYGQTNQINFKKYDKIQIDADCYTQISPNFNELVGPSVKLLSGVNPKLKNTNSKIFNILNAQYKNGDLKIVCQKDFEDHSENIHVLASGSTENNTIVTTPSGAKIRYPFIAINPISYDVAYVTENKTRAQRTIFHEFLHNAGLRHVLEKEFVYTCASCCIGDAKSEENKFACKLCANDIALKDELDHDYFVTLTDWLTENYESDDTVGIDLATLTIYEKWFDLQSNVAKPNNKNGKAILIHETFEVEEPIMFLKLFSFYNEVPFSTFIKSPASLLEDDLESSTALDKLFKENDKKVLDEYGEYLKLDFLNTMGSIFTTIHTEANYSWVELMKKVAAMNKDYDQSQFDRLIFNLNTIEPESKEEICTQIKNIFKLISTNNNLETVGQEARRGKSESELLASIEYLSLELKFIKSCNR